MKLKVYTFLIFCHENTFSSAKLKYLSKRNLWEKKHFAQNEPEYVRKVTKNLANVLYLTQG